MRALPFDVIKLGRSLVEGVESVDLMDSVAVLGGDAVQGYAIARPMPAPHFTEWMRQYGDAYDAPDRMYPKGPLATLAKLLIWESHVQLLFGSSLSSVVEIPTNYTLIPPFRSVDPALQTSHLDLATRHRMRSPEYLAARDRLIAALH
jgi:hypothetical protein